MNAIRLYILNRVRSSSVRSAWSYSFLQVPDKVWGNKRHVECVSEKTTRLTCRVLTQNTQLQVLIIAFKDDVGAV